MRNEFPPSDKCDFCDNLHTKQTTDGADLCIICYNDNVVTCECGDKLVWERSLYCGSDCIQRCQLCDQRQTEQEIGKLIEKIGA